MAYSLGSTLLPLQIFGEQSNKISHSAHDVPLAVLLAIHVSSRIARQEPRFAQPQSILNSQAAFGEAIVIGP